MLFYSEADLAPDSEIGVLWYFFGPPKLHFVILGCIEHMKCGLLQSMIPTSVSQSVTWKDCAETAERIDVLFGAETTGNPRNTVSDGVPIPQRRR